VHAREIPQRIKAREESLAKSFIQRARNDVNRFREMLERARQGDLTPLSEIERLAHTIHGAGAIFGYPAISASGRAIERLAAQLVAGRDPPGEHMVIGQLAEITEQLALEVEMACGIPPDAGPTLQPRIG